MKQGQRTRFAALRQALRSGPERPGRAAGRSQERLTGALELAADCGRVDAETVEAGRAAARGTGAAAGQAAALTRLLESLVQAQQCRRQLLREQMHGLSTPLTLIRANLRVLRLTPDLEPAVQAALLAELDADVALVLRLLDDLAAAGDAAGPV